MGAQLRGVGQNGRTPLTSATSMAVASAVVAACTLEPFCFASNKSSLGTTASSSPASPHASIHSCERSAPLTYSAGSRTAGDNWLHGRRCAVALGLMLGMSSRFGVVRKMRRGKVRRHAEEQEKLLEGFPVHGVMHYWSLSEDLASLVIFVPVGNDVVDSDVLYECSGDKSSKLYFGLQPDMGGIVIDDQLLHEVDTEKSTWKLDVGLYGERCLVAVLPKAAKQQDWYDSEVEERFLTHGDRSRALSLLKITHRTFMDVEIDGETAGRIVFGLWGEFVPRTVENFRCLCTGEKGVSKDSGKPLHYRGTSFHRVIPGFCVQGGEIVENGDGSGGESIYGPTFEDESLKVRFKRKGILAMANDGPDKNGSQFFILTSKAEHLNHTCVGFGEVLDGFDVLEKIQELGEDDWYPGKRVVITECGELCSDKE